MDENTVKYLNEFFREFQTVEEKAIFALKTLADEGGENRKKVPMIVNGQRITVDLGDPKVRAQADKQIGVLEREFAERIAKEFPDRIYLNYCPNCGKLARTPSAKQCRHCGTDWHLPTRSDEIQQLLTDIETKHNVRILYAAESGSRGWGFPSTDSDYDVRFLFAQPVHNYLTVGNLKEEIHLPIDDELDAAGWDLRKSLILLRKSNAALFEWLQSPIIYRGADFSKRMAKLLQDAYNPKAMIHHYLSLAGKIWDENKEVEQIRLKKLYYVIRSLLVVKWIDRRKSYPPMQLNVLIDMVRDEPRMEVLVRSLRARKMRAGEGATTPLFPELVTWIEAAFEEGHKTAERIQPKSSLTTEALDKFFHEEIQFSSDSES